VSASLRLLLLIAGALVAVALFFVFRGDDDGGSQAQATTTTGTTQATQTDVERPAVFNIDARTPEIKRISVKRNRMVVIVVTTDRSEVVHLHGYDLKSDATPRRPARIAFRADQPGRFEIELEESGEQIAELTVTP
jgi:hypothetical protein